MTTPRLPTLLLTGLLGSTLLRAADAPAPAAVPAGAALREIVNGKTWFRFRQVTRPMAFVDATNSVPRPDPKVKAPLSPNPDDTPPPENWTEGGFDDSSWPRLQLDAQSSLADTKLAFLGAFRVLLRARFEVTDPAAVQDLNLHDLRLEGGVIVYLNGREVARAGMPEGALAATAAALPYPDDAWLTPEGRPIPANRNGMPKPQREECEARVARRTRTAAPVVLPVAALRKGANVLAIEIRRSDSHPKAAAEWTPINLDAASLRLTAAGSGIVPNVARPQGLRVWVEDINTRIGENDWANPCESVGPVRFAGARNGTFGAMVVVAQPGKMKNAQVTVSDLRAVKGGAVIPSATVELLSAGLSPRAYGVARWFDNLQAGLPADVAPTQRSVAYGKPLVDDAAMLPVYLRLRIPRDAAPGDYCGTVTVQVAGAAPVAVPVEVSVSAYALPDTKDFRTYVGLYQSPTSVAMQYKVKEWSEEHWKLLEPSFALLARAGNKMVNIPIVEQTQFGNDEGMVYWVRKADASADQPPKPGEAFDYDFSVFDRFLALAQKHFGTPDYVALQIWHSGGWDARKADQENTVTVVDPRTGKHTRMQVPAFDTAESKAFWKPLLAACHECLAKRGLDKAMCIGILSDGTASKEVLAAFDEIWPGGAPARWTRGLHRSCGLGGPYKLDGGGVCVLHEHCYGAPMFLVSDPITGLSTYRGGPATAYFRAAGFETGCTLMGYRILTDIAIFQRRQGLGRIGFDFWPVIEVGRNRQVIYNRYPHSSCAQRAPALYSLSWPGQGGAETTQRFEVLCQGIQESETILAISQALDQRGDRLDQALAGRCRQLLSDRLWFATSRPNFAPWPSMANHLNHYGWQELDRRSFDCAAAVAAP